MVRYYADCTCLHDGNKPDISSYMYLHYFEREKIIETLQS